MEGRVIINEPSAENNPNESYSAAKENRPGTGQFIRKLTTRLSTRSRRKKRKSPTNHVVASGKESTTTSDLQNGQGKLFDGCCIDAGPTPLKFIVVC